MMLKEIFENDFKHSFSVGATSGFISSLLTAPFETINKKLFFERKYSNRSVAAKQTFAGGAIATINEIYQWKGLEYFFRSEGYISPRLVLAVGLNFSLKQWFKNQQLKHLENQDESRVPINFASGALAGLVSELITYPLRFLQTKYRSHKSNSSFNSIFRTYGPLGLYQGFMVSGIHHSLYRAFYFGIYDSLRYELVLQKSFNLLVSLPVGLIAAFTSLTVAFPLNKLSQRMIESGESGINSFLSIYSENGWKGFLKNWRMNILGSVRGATVLTFNDAIQYLCRRQHKFY